MVPRRELMPILREAVATPDPVVPCHLVHIIMPSNITSSINRVHLRATTHRSISRRSSSILITRTDPDRTTIEHRTIISKVLRIMATATVNLETTMLPIRHPVQVDRPVLDRRRQ